MAGTKLDRGQWRVLLAMLSVLALATSARAMPPAGLGHVDPKAPCFRWPAVDYDGDGVFDRIDRCPDTPKGCVVDGVGCPLDADGDGVCDGIDRCPDTPKGEAVDEHGCSAMQRTATRAAQSAPTSSTTAPREVSPSPPTPQVSEPANETERQLLEGGQLRLENVYFETNSATLLPESETTLDQVGQALEKFVDLRIEVQGHTDTRGSAAHNLRLSQARAESVRQFLLDHFHLQPDHLVAKGYGETQPETRERNDEERLRNRRVVLKVLNPEALPHNVKVREAH